MENPKPLRMPEDVYLSLSDISWFGLPKGYILRARDLNPEDDSDLEGMWDVPVY